MKKLLSLLIIIILIPVLMGAIDPWVIPYDLMVSMGLIEGSVLVNKYGNCNGSTIGAAYQDIWSRTNTGNFLYPTTATTVSIVSGSTEDKIDGTGVYQIMIYGVDENQLMQSELISLTGTTPVVTTSLWWRIYRMQSYTNGTANVDIENGLITATVDTKIIAEMPIDGTTTYMCAVSVPADLYGYLKTYQFSSGNKETASVEIVSRRSPTAPWVRGFSLLVSEEVHQAVPVHAVRFPPGADIRWRAKQNGVSAVAPHGSFQMEFKPN